jgi:hypothetical protein
MSDREGVRVCAPRTDAVKMCAVDVIFTHVSQHGLSGRNKNSYDSVVIYKFVICILCTRVSRMLCSKRSGRVFIVVVW